MVHQCSWKSDKKVFKERSQVKPAFFIQKLGIGLILIWLEIIKLLNESCTFHKQVKAFYPLTFLISWREVYDFSEYGLIS